MRTPGHRVCSVIIKSLAGVRRRYEYGGDLSPPMTERLSAASKCQTCLRRPAERPHRSARGRFSCWENALGHGVRRATCESLGAPTVFQTGGAEEERTEHKSRRQGLNIFRGGSRGRRDVSRRRPPELQCCNYQGCMTLKEHACDGGGKALSDVTHPPPSSPPPPSPSDGLTSGTDRQKIGGRVSGQNKAGARRSLCQQTKSHCNLERRSRGEVRSPWQQEASNLRAAASAEI